MVGIATLLSRSEALVVAAKLDAAGIPVDVGGDFYTSVSPDILARWAEHQALGFGPRLPI